MTFNSINEAMIWFRVSLMKRFSKNSEIQKLKLDEKIDDRVHAYNKMNKLLDIIISKNKNKGYGYLLSCVPRIICLILLSIVSFPFFHRTDDFKYNKDIVRKSFL